MNGIKFIKDENGQPHFVQIDLTVHGELWEDFYDLLIAEQRENEESIPFEEVINILKTNNLEEIQTEPMLRKLVA